MQSVHQLRNQMGMGIMCDTRENLQIYSAKVLSNFHPTIYLLTDDVHVDDMINLLTPLIPKIITQQVSTTFNVTSDNTTRRIRVL